MDLKLIKELMTAMERSGIKKLTLKQKGGDELHLEKHDEVSNHPAPAHYPQFYAPPLHREPTSALSHPVPIKEESSSKGEKIETGRCIQAPLVGTFYTAASPEDPSFVKVGDKVDENTVVCIIEAMKVMNEVKAGLSGTIAEMLVENAHPVEFGTKLFRVV